MEKEITYPRKFIPEIQIIVTMTDTPDVYYTLKSSQDAYDMSKEVFSKSVMLFKEEAFIVCLSKANKAIGWYKISSGGVTGTIIDPKIVFTLALNAPGTCSILLMHNHPSGNLQPSEADKRITKQIRESGKILDITLLDHLIVTMDSYYSFADNGEL